MDNNSREVVFIARHYRRGKFSVDKGWRRLGLAPSAKRKRIRVAAAIAGVVFLSAAATMIYRQNQTGGASETPAVSTRPARPAFVVRVIDFDSTPLPVVIDRIEEVYGVEVDNVPADAGMYNLSLHYEGNAIDLVATINDILGTQMSVRE